MQQDESRPETLPVWEQLLWTNNHPTGIFATQRIETHIDALLKEDKNAIGTPESRFNHIVGPLQLLVQIAGNRLFPVFTSIESRHRFTSKTQIPLYPMPTPPDTILVVKNVYEIAEWRSPVGIRCIQKIVLRKDPALLSDDNPQLINICEAMFTFLYNKSSGFNHPIISTTFGFHNGGYINELIDFGLFLSESCQDLRNGGNVSDVFVDENIHTVDTVPAVLNKGQFVLSKKLCEYIPMEIRHFMNTGDENAHNKPVQFNFGNGYHQGDYLEPGEFVLSVRATTLYKGIVGPFNTALNNESVQININDWDAIRKQIDQTIEYSTQAELTLLKKWENAIQQRTPVDQTPTGGGAKGNDGGDTNSPSFSQEYEDVDPTKQRCVYCNTFVPNLEFHLSSFHTDNAIKYYENINHFDKDMQSELVVVTNNLVLPSKLTIRYVHPSEVEQMYRTGIYKTVWFPTQVSFKTQKTFVSEHPEYRILATKRYILWNTMSQSKFDVLANMGEDRRNLWIAAIQKTGRFAFNPQDLSTIYHIIGVLSGTPTLLPINQEHAREKDAFVMWNCMWYDAALVIAAIQQAFEPEFDAVHFNTEKQYEFATNLIICQKNHTKRSDRPDH